MNLVLFHAYVPKVHDDQGLLHQVVHDQVLELVFFLLAYIQLADLQLCLRLVMKLGSLYKL